MRVKERFSIGTRQASAVAFYYFLQIFGAFYFNFFSEKKTPGSKIV